MNLDPTKKPILIEKPIPAQCEISIDNRDYFPVKNKPMTAPSYSAYSNASIGHSQETTNTVLNCDRNFKEKGTVQ